MAEVVFNKMQIGRQAALGTPVAATILFPVDSGVVIDLDRAYLSPNEDYGGRSRHRPDRGTYGVRGAQLSFNADARFEDIIDLLEMGLAGGVTPSGAGPYTWAYAADELTHTLRPYTIEVGDETQEWETSDALVDTLDIGYDALSAPGNTPWRVAATILGGDRLASTFTGGLSARAGLETAEGHLTTLAEGTTATAFASLTALTGSLVSYRFRLNNNLVRRVYGGATDVFTAWGFSDRREVSVEAMVKMTATTKTNIHDIFNAAGALAQERRWRILATGSGTKTLTIDQRVRFEAVPIGERDGEHVYNATAHTVYDSTNASDLKITVVNSISAI